MKQKILLPIAKSLIKLIGKMYVIPGHNINGVAFIANLLVKDLDMANKIISMDGIDNWSQSIKDSTIDLLGSAGDEYQFNNQKNYHKKMARLWRKGIEQGLINNLSDNDKILNSIRQASRLDNSGDLVKTWIENQPLSENIIHEVGVEVLKWSGYNDIWNKIINSFQDKYLDKLNPEHTFKKDNNTQTLRQSKIDKDGIKFIAMALAYAPESFCMKMIEKTKSIDGDDLALLLKRGGKRRATSIKMIEMIAEKSGGMEEMIKKTFKKYTVMVDIKNKIKNDTDEDILDKINYLKEDNPEVGLIFKKYWTSIMAQKEKDIIKEQIKNNGKAIKSNKLVRKI